MRRMNCNSGMLLLAVFVAVGTAWAGVPGSLKGLVYSGRISPADEEEALSMTFRLYDAPTNGICRWGRNYSVLVAKGGAFDQVLSDEAGEGNAVEGLTNDLATAIAQCVQATGGVWMELAVGPAAGVPLPFSARQQLLSVPVAAMAAKALSCDVAIAPKLSCENDLTVTGQVVTAVLHDRQAGAHSLSVKACPSNGVMTVVLHGLTSVTLGQPFVVQEKFRLSDQRDYSVLSPTVVYENVGNSFRSVIYCPGREGGIVFHAYRPAGDPNQLVSDSSGCSEMVSIGGANTLIGK